MMLPDLTPVEKELVQVIMSGTTNLKGIAQRLGIKFTSVRWKLNEVYRKYGVGDMISLAIAVRFEHLSNHIGGIADPLQCDCGKVAIWRAIVMINGSPDKLLLCDECRKDHKGQVEPAVMVLSNEEYAKLHDVAVRRLTLEKLRINKQGTLGGQRKNGVQVKATL